MTIRATYSRV